MFPLQKADNHDRQNAGHLFTHLHGYELPLLERLLKLFQPETLEGENAFWCGDCQESHRATKTLSCKNIPTILITLGSNLP